MDSVDDDSNTFTDLEIQPKVDSLQHFFSVWKAIGLISAHYGKEPGSQW